MDSNILVLLCVAVNLLGVFLSAALWNKRPMLRRLPIAATTFSGLIFSLLNPEINGFLSITLTAIIFFALGLVFYFAVWIQCKD